MLWIFSPPTGKGTAILQGMKYLKLFKTPPICEKIKSQIFEADMRFSDLILYAYCIFGHTHIIHICISMVCNLKLSFISDIVSMISFSFRFEKNTIYVDTLVVI